MPEQFSQIPEQEKDAPSLEEKEKTSWGDRILNFFSFLTDLPIWLKFVEFLLNIVRVIWSGIRLIFSWLKNIFE